MPLISTVAEGLSQKLSVTLQHMALANPLANLLHGLNNFQTCQHGQDNPLLC